MHTRSDPTANIAVSSVSRQWRQMAGLALRIRRSGDFDWAGREKRRFRGTFARLLAMPEPILRREAGCPARDMPPSSTDP